MIPDNLHRTLLFASALQVLGANHAIARSLEMAVQQRDADALLVAEKAIEALAEEERRELFERFEDLCQQLPIEALAA